MGDSWGGGILSESCACCVCGGMSRLFALIVPLGIAVSDVQLAEFASAAQGEVEEGSTGSKVVDRFGPSPKITTGAYSEELEAAVKLVFSGGLKSGRWGGEQFLGLKTIVESKDVRIAWPLTDLMRMPVGEELTQLLFAAVSDLTQVTPNPKDPWGSVVEHLMAWDVPEPPGYLAQKREIFSFFVPGWEPLFQPGDVNWRHVTWGGVLIDDRPFDTTDEPCNCIPAADNPAVTDVGGADWLDDDDVVFGVAIGGEARAYPRQIMEVREMVNDTLGGRHLAMPYCTLCGSAQAYFTDGLPEGVERPIMRTSGLLIRSNKVMYDFVTKSVFDTFLGAAVTGPLAAKGIKLQQAGVVTTTWGAWKREHPMTTVLEERLALGRNFDFRNGRDADGPIFPIGRVDPRLKIQDDIVGVILPDGQPVAFPVEAVRRTLDAGEVVRHGSVSLVRKGGGFLAVDSMGADVGGHQAFWFAWSQFHPNTVVWSAPSAQEPE